MSDPLTNVEIEDVLSSIRRLVSDGDKARTRDPAPLGVAPDPAQDTSDSASTPAESGVGHLQDKLVLTPALRVVDGAVSAKEAVAPSDAPATQDEIPADDSPIPEEALAENDMDVPLTLTEMVWDTRPTHVAEAESTVEEFTAPDRSELVATIAELEAAMSSGSNDYEPDGSELGEGEYMGETIAWPGVISRSTDQIEDAETAPEPVEKVEAGEVIEDNDVQQDPPADDQVDDNLVGDEHADDDTLDSDAAISEPENETYGDEDLDGLLEAGGVSFDEDALRALVAEIVREELTGPMGERITRNVRKLVRREIYRVLSSQEFQ